MPVFAYVEIDAQLKPQSVDLVEVSDLVNVFRDGVCPLGFGQAGLDRLDPLAREVLEGEDIRPEADPVLIG